MCRTQPPPRGVSTCGATGTLRRVGQPKRPPGTTWGRLPPALPTGRRLLGRAPPPRPPHGTGGHALFAMTSRAHEPALLPIPSPGHRTRPSPVGAGPGGWDRVQHAQVGGRTGSLTPRFGSGSLKPPRRGPPRQGYPPGTRGLPHSARGGPPLQGGGPCVRDLRRVFIASAPPWPPEYISTEPHTLVPGGRPVPFPGLGQPPRGDPLSGWSGRSAEVASPAHQG
jgi:hypothetical protein